MIVNRHIATQSPYNGLSPNVLNVPAQWVGYPAASASNNVRTTANWLSSSANAISKSIAAGTQPQTPRPVQILLSPNTASSSVSLYSSGSIILYGKDIKGSSASESYAISAFNSVSDPTQGTVNWASIQSISFHGVAFATDQSSAASAVSIYIGQAAKIGLPFNLLSSDGVLAVHIGSAGLSTWSGATSSDNGYTITTGDYRVNGIAAAWNVASLAVVDYVNLGFRAPTGSY